MNDAAYRIDVQHTPNDPCEWYASATRLSDDDFVMGSGQYADTPEEAIDKVREWLSVEATKRQGFSVYVDETGTPAASPVERISAYSQRVT